MQATENQTMKIAGAFAVGEPLLPIVDVSQPDDAGGSLIALLLAEQQQLTAVEQFSREHKTGDIPAQAKHYAKLLPATPPGDGQQYAFEVDLDRCSGCMACVTACHTLNGLDDEETFRDVGLMIGGTSANPIKQHVTTACHHCLEPACMSACPVDAYEKDAVTGIVKHLDDQCFGCQYCTLACPYDVPKYHHQKGIVRKCDMCSSRLAVGEAPACVQACPHEAIAITLVEIRDVKENAEADYFLPAAPEPHITYPTTHYKTSRVFPRNTLPADYHATSPQHPHWPLILMLVLTQLSVGAFVAGLVLDQMLSSALLATFAPLHATTALMFGLMALGASTLHLGRPQYAFRAIVGLRHSWLSREILAFGLFAGAVIMFSASSWVEWTPGWLNDGLGWCVAVTGTGGVFCSVMVYAFTRREFWSFPQTATKFVLTSALLGIAATWLCILLLGVAGESASAHELATVAGDKLSQALIALAAAKLLFELSLFRHLAARRVTPLKRSAWLMLGRLSNHSLARFALGLLGGICMPLFLLSRQLTGGDSAGVIDIVIVAMLFTACLVGELLERYLFFAACSAPRMPGLPSA
jgi:Fe-S-cluster-containing dehydrogenase component/DMSO reductase anchor subunit